MRLTSKNATSSKVLFAIFLIISRVFSHIGYFGFSTDRVIATIFTFALIALTILYFNKIIKLMISILIGIVLIFSVYQIFSIYSLGGGVSLFSWMSFAFLALSLIALWLIPVLRPRERADYG